MNTAPYDFVQYIIVISRVAEPESRGVGFLTTLGVGFFVRLRMFNSIIFYITLLNWEFLLKW